MTRMRDEGRATARPTSTTLAPTETAPGSTEMMRENGSAAPPPVDAGAVGRTCADCDRPAWRAAGTVALCFDHWAAWTAHFGRNGGAPEDDNEPSWPPLLPLGSAAEVPPFPVSALPSVMESFVTAAAETTRTPIDLAAGFALGALGAITAGRADVSPWPG
jgi:hypothetical protein